MMHDYHYYQENMENKKIAATGASQSVKDGGYVSHISGGETGNGTQSGNHSRMASAHVKG